MKKYGSLRKGDLREFQYHILLAIPFLLCSFLEVEFLIVVFFRVDLHPMVMYSAEIVRIIAHFSEMLWKLL